jgi:FixJ family two-component response regulator
VRRRPNCARFVTALCFLHGHRAKLNSSSNPRRRLVGSERTPRSNRIGGVSALCFGSAEQFLGSRARHEASCLITDIRMPGMSGLELQAKLSGERCRPIPTIFITGRGDIPMAVRARAFQQDRANRREAIEHEKFVARYETLTPRGRDVLALLVRGLLNKQAGFELGITEYTVQVHRAHIMRKMEADSFATLARLAARFTVEPPPGVEQDNGDQQPLLRPINR